MDVSTLQLSVDANGVVTGTARANKALDDVEKKSSSVESSLKKLEQAAGMLGIAFGLFEVVKWTQETLLLGARYETLGVVMDVIGRNAGHTRQAMDEFAKSLEHTGISTIGARESLAKMAAAQIDLAKSSQLARVAQNAAVIANVNSTEAFETLIQGITTGMPRVLRTLGIYVDLVAGQERYAASMHKTRDSLTALEKIQANTNTVLQGGAAIQGAYTAAMDTAGKQLLSTVRYMEDFREKASKAFQPELTAAVFAYANALKFLGSHAGQVSALAAAVFTLVAGVLALKVAIAAATLPAVSGMFITLRLAVMGVSGVVPALAASFAALAATVLPLVIIGGGLWLLSEILHNNREEARLFAEEVDGAALSLRQMQEVNYRRQRMSFYEAAGIPAPEALRKAIADARRFYADILGGKPVGTGDGGTPPASPVEYQRQRQDRENALNQQMALNAAYRQSAHELRLLTIERDREAERAQNAIGHTQAQAAALNALTDRMAAAKVVAENLAEVTTRHRAAMDAFNNTLQTQHQLLVTQWQEAANKNVAATQRMIDKNHEYEASLKAIEVANNTIKERGSIGPQGGGSEKSMVGGLLGMLGGGMGGMGGGSGIGGIVGLFQAIPGIGQVASTVAGLLGSLADSIFGTGQAAVDAAAQMDASRRKVETTLSFRRYRDSLEGSPLTNELDKLDITFRSWRDQINKDVPDVAGPNGRREMLKELDRLNALAIAKAKTDEAIRQREMQEDYAVRTMRAKGFALEADALVYAQTQQREYAKAVKDGADTTSLAALAEAQKAEASQHAADMAQSAFRALEDLGVRLMRANGNGSGADDWAFALQQQREYEDAVRNGASAAYLAKLRQVQLAEATVQASTKIKATIDGLKNTITTLTSFSLSLKFGSGSTLSPVDQLAAARAQYRAISKLALAGDQTAAGQLPEIARAFLDISRQVNASSMAYQADLKDVQDVIDTVTSIFQGQMDAQQKMLDALGSNGPIVMAIISKFDEQIPVLYAGFTDLSNKTAALADAVDRGNNKLAKALEGISLN